MGMEKIEFYAYGHELVKATHRSTLEITKEDYLTESGDCIIGIRANLSCNELPERIKSKVRDDNSRVVLIIRVDGLREYIFGYGSRKLPLSSNTSMVIRKSSYIDSRTLMIKANKAARDISRRVVNRLKKRDKKIFFTLVVFSYEGDDRAPKD